MTDGAAGGTPGDGGKPAQASGQDDQGKPAGGTPDQGGDDLAGLRSALQAEREARREADRERSQMAARIRALETKDLPEAERTQRELSELRDQVKARDAKERALRLEIAVVRHAARLGFTDPDDALTWALRNQDDLEWTKDGEPKDVDKRLADLLKAKPYLASPASRPTGDVGQGQRGATQVHDMNAAIRRAAGRPS